ncbi:amino acid permease [Bartonella harrusi]|uniref:Amino acid permease n=1 Tax=Bartonella harrusi TaxID=2961895 RepID=A0ABY5ES01_9HYPH|nr:amino acid permease [Bartonella harrusi]UTO27870.1 amino acid permease [Bartonella harrusi]
MNNTQNLEDNPQQKLQRGLDNRHVQLIALGGAIGTGLFMGSGKTISVAGPSIILVYAIIGCALYFVMRAMGELLLSNSQYRSLVDFSTDMLGPGIAFFVGWSYWLSWVVTGAADIIAIITYLHFWWPTLNPWIIVFSCIAFFLVFNLFAVKLFGELEFWFGLIKIVAILALIVVGLYMIVTGFTAPNGTVASFGHVWNGGDIFPRGITGFFAGFQIAIFSFIGIEIAGTTAAEVKNPKEVLPKAINAIPVRIMLFYILSLAIIMSVTPWNQVVPEKSPFVAMFWLAGIPIAAGLINFVVLTSAASSANSGIFSTSRMIYGLATQSGAPRFMGKLSKYHVPANALFFSCLCIFLGYAITSLSPSIISAFTIVTSISAIALLFVWSVILVSYIVYRRKHPQLHAESIYKMPIGNILCWLILAFFVFMLYLLTLEHDTFIALKCGIVWFIFLSITYFLFVKKKMTQGNK